MGTKVPAVNILDNDDEYTVEMAARGMKKEDFKIDLDNNFFEMQSAIERMDSLRYEFYKDFEYKIP